MPKSKTRHAVNLRRLYVDCQAGQLHVHSAFPSSGGFDEETTLIAIHGDGQSGRALRAFATELGDDRSVFVPDLPGHGESDPLGQPADHAASVAALGDFLDQMRFRQVDLFGMGSGAAVVIDLALARPQQVRRLVVCDAPADALERVAGVRSCQEVPAQGDVAALARSVRAHL